MNTFTSKVSLAVLGVMLFVPAALSSPDSDQPRLVTVTAQGEVRVSPDEVSLKLGVETKNDDIAQAKAEGSEIVRKVLEVADQHGVSPEHVKTDYVSIEPQWTLSGYGSQPSFDGYRYRQTIEIRLSDLSKYEPVLSDALSAGATYVHGIDFRTTELRKYKDQARALAVLAAREKAAALAGELGQEIGRPHSIKEESSSWWPSYQGRWWGSQYAMASNAMAVVPGGGPADGSLSPGQLMITAVVTASFELK